MRFAWSQLLLRGGDIWIKFLAFEAFEVEGLCVLQLNVKVLTSFDRFVCYLAIVPSSTGAVKTLPLLQDEGKCLKKRVFNRADGKTRKNEQSVKQTNS